MAPFELVLRFLGLLLTFILPASLIGALLGGAGLAILLAGVSFLVFLASFCSLEAWVRNQLGEAAIEWPGLSRSLEQALWEAGRTGTVPRILVIPEPMDQVMVMRSAWGGGTILISQGILAAQDESSLRKTLLRAAEGLSQRGVVFQGACSMISLWILRLAPLPCIRLFLSSERVRSRQSVAPVSALRFLALFPWFRLLVRIGRLELLSPENTSLLISPIYLLVNLSRQG